MKKLIEKAQNDTSIMWLVVLVSFLTGIVAGILIAPVKNGLSIASNNTIIGGDDDDDDDENYGFDDDEDIKF